MSDLEARLLDHDSLDAIVTGTHDVEAARAALHAFWVELVGTEEAEDEMCAYARQPEQRRGAWRETPYGDPALEWVDSALYDFSANPALVWTRS